MRRKQLEEKLLALNSGKCVYIKFTGAEGAVRSLLHRINMKLKTNFSCHATNRMGVFEIMNKGVAND
jgi:hypothetical protein